jgi:hypothetical protein
VKHSTIYIGALLLSVTGCRQPRQPTTAANDSTATVKEIEQKSFFPVADYIRGEMHYVDSMPLALLEYRILGNRTDSSFIHADEFHRIAGEFLLPDLEKGNFEKKYSENSFMDETSGYLTFTYSPRDKALPLQRVDVLATPSATVTAPARIKSVYLQTFQTSADTVIVKKMLWIAKKSLLIVTSLQPNGKPPIVRQVKLVWDSSTDE